MCVCGSCLCVCKTALENIGGVGGEGSGSNDVPHAADGGTGGVPVVLISNCICVLRKELVVAYLGSKLGLMLMTVCIVQG